MTVRIDILICTFRRPVLEQALRSLALQRPPSGIALGIIVADNDTTPSAAPLVAQLAKDSPHPVTYVHAPERNISVARNACLQATTADWVAFLDDDETAPPDWIANLWAAVQSSGVDAVFGPAMAQFPSDAPDWIVALDMHSNHPEARGGVVMTGHTCNALLRWQGAPWLEARFDPALGRSGGEDTAFFFDLYRRGARFAIAKDAPVHEIVTPERLRAGWLFRRRFRMGQSYVASVRGVIPRLGLAASAAAKASFSGVMAILNLTSARRASYWALRATLHAGVIAGCARVPQAQSYGR